MPLFELGAAAISSLANQIAGGAPCDYELETEPELVVRASTARRPVP